MNPVFSFVITFLMGAFRSRLTNAKAQQTVHSLTTVDRWWFEVLRGERGPDGIFGVETLKDKIYNDYKAWCESGRRRPERPQNFWKILRSRVGPRFSEKKRRRGSVRKREVWLPPRHECQAVFGKAVGCPWSELEAL